MKNFILLLALIAVMSHVHAQVYTVDTQETCKNWMLDVCEIASQNALEHQIIRVEMRSSTTFEHIVTGTESGPTASLKTVWDGNVFRIDSICFDPKKQLFTLNDGIINTDPWLMDQVRQVWGYYFVEYRKPDQ